MNKGTAFILGLVLGGAGGGFIANTILKQQYSQKANDEITGCRDAFAKELARVREEAVKHLKNVEDMENQAKEAMDTYRGTTGDSGTVDNQPPFEPDDPPASKNNKRQEISDDEFNDESSPMKKVSLTYFPEDGIVMRENGTFMDKEDIEVTIGFDTLNRLNDEDNPVDSICIRNFTFQADYEVVVSSVSYKDWKQRHP